MGFDEIGDTITLADVFASEQEDPSMQASRQVDWEMFLRQQTKRGRTLVAVVAEGSTLRAVARLLDLSETAACPKTEQR